LYLRNDLTPLYEAYNANITSEEGILLRVNRSIPVEGAFGVTKEDSRFRRFMTRGKAGVRGEFFRLLTIFVDRNEKIRYYVSIR
jgi:hypothetical protein